MPPRDWRFRIEDILEAIAKIQRYVSGMGLDDFENDEEAVDAVIHNLTVIGEAADHIPEEVTSQHSEIPWRLMIDMRNLAVHGYWNLLPSVIWNTVQNDLPPLAEPLRQLLGDFPD
jgi:uncharacterized protein with HEPN domain